MKKTFGLKRTKAYLIGGSAVLVLGAALLLLAPKSPAFAQWYTENIYGALVSTVGRIFGLFPFSVSEVLLYAVSIAIVLLIAGLVIRLMRKKAGRPEVIRFVSGVFCLAAVLLFLYAANCGVNYHRTSFAESIGLEAGDYTVGQLEETCIYLTEAVNSAAEDVARDAEGVMLLTGDTEAAARGAMISLSEDFSCLEGYYPEPKGLIFPWILSVQKITGIYSPFTIEANYNSGMTDYNIPFTECHELSHLRGFMQEEEANFIAWLACATAEDPEFRYSGNMRGWISCMNALYSADQETWAKLRVQLSPLAEADLAANREYWDKYEGKIAETAEKVNDGYLKANGQGDGVKSYGRMADLIVAWMTEK